MTEWFIIDAIIILAYGLQHTLLTTKIFVTAYNKILPKFTWNIVYSILSVITLVIGFKYWQPSYVDVFRFVPGSVSYHLMTILLALSLFFFFYCFKYTTSFWQWLGVKQVAVKIKGENMPEYYRVRKEGVKRYIRFPHHTCFIFFFWFHPVMTLDTLLLAVGATIYLYVGTYHQDLRGLSAIGESWKEYRKDTCLLIPGPRLIAKIWREMFGVKKECTGGAVKSNAS